MTRQQKVMSRRTPAQCEDIDQLRVAPGTEHGVACKTGEQRAVASVLELQGEQAGMGWVPHSVAQEKTCRTRTDEIELVVNVDDNPVRELKVSDDELLPLWLRRSWRVVEADADRHWDSESFPTRNIDGDREDGRRIPATREGHETGCSLEQRPDRLLERLARGR